MWLLSAERYSLPGCTCTVHVNVRPQHLGSRHGNYMEPWQTPSCYEVSHQTCIHVSLRHRYGLRNAPWTWRINQIFSTPPIYHTPHHGTGGVNNQGNMSHHNLPHSQLATDMAEPKHGLGPWWREVCMVPSHTWHNSDKGMSLQNSSCRHEPVQPMWPNWHTTTSHDRVQSREGHMGLDSIMPSNNPSHKETSSSSWMAAQTTILHLASTAAWGYPTDSCTLSTLSHPTLPPNNPDRLCGLHASSKLEGVPTPTPIETSVL